MRSKKHTTVAIAGFVGLLVLAIVLPPVGFGTPSARLGSRSQAQPSQMDATTPPILDRLGSEPPALRADGTSRPPTRPTNSPPPQAVAWPGPGNTGVPAGTVLTPHAGNLIITRAGAVVDALDISNGCIDIQAPKVTIKRTRIRSSTPCSSQALIQDGYTNSGVVIEDTEIDGLGSQVTGVGNSGMTLLRVNIHGVGTGVHIDGAYVTVQDSWVHDIREVAGSHDDTVYTGGSAHVVIRHNALENPLTQTSVIILSAWADPVTDWQVDSNLVNGGGYTIYGGEGSAYPISYIRYTNNHFGRKFYPNCGVYGPVVYWSSTAPGNIWSGNIWDDSGQPVAP